VFYFAKTSINNEGGINIWRLLLALVVFGIAHVPGYFSLMLWAYKPMLFRLEIQTSRSRFRHYPSARKVLPGMRGVIMAP
jgi:hypothetical protein